MTDSECPICHEVKPDVESRRQNTSYQDDDLNFVVCCLSCYEWVEECWAEQWEDYNRGRL